MNIYDELQHGSMTQNVMDVMGYCSCLYCNRYFDSGKGPCGKYTVTLLPNENPNKIMPSGGSWLTGIDRFINWPKSYLCWMYGGHVLVEHDREYHYDSSETAHCYCTRCDMWVPF